MSISIKFDLSPSLMLLFVNFESSFGFGFNIESELETEVDSSGFLDFLIASAFGGLVEPSIAFRN